MQVANLSLGAATDPSATVRQAFQLAYDSGIVLVASTANSGTQEGQDVGFPARYDTVMAVGATSSISPDMTFAGRTGFSSYGQAVELLAPGTFIRTTLPNDQLRVYGVYQVPPSLHPMSPELPL
jgi:subtilisin